AVRKDKISMKRDPSLKRRVYFLIAVMGLWGAAIGARLYFLHVVYSSDYKQRAERQQQRTFEVTPQRGVIYDRNKNELAISIKVDEEGMGGLEYRYNGSVRGETGRAVIMTDARGRSFNSIEQPAAPGANLITTIDENIQYILEQELTAAAARTHAKGISIIAM